MKRPEEQLSYRVYVLRSWQEGDPSSRTPAVWRFSLEDPTTRQRRGFGNLEALTGFLAAETEQGAASSLGASARDKQERNDTPEEQ